MLDCQKHLFDLDPKVTYLNCAYMSPQLTAVTETGFRMLRKKGRPNEITPDDFFSPVTHLKQLAAKVINTSEPDRIALVPSVSYGMANVAYNLNLQPEQEVVMVAEQFPSNYYIWEREVRLKGGVLKIVELPDIVENRGKVLNQEILNAITEKTALVAIGNVHWADGTLLDLMAIREKSNKFDAKLVIDGTQSVGALPINVDELQPDALITACYKWMFGPYQSGIAYYGPAFDNGLPIEENWINRLNSHDFKNLVNYQPEYKPLANRYSAGEHSNFIMVEMVKRAFEQLLEWKVPAIQEYCGFIASNFLATLKDMGCQIADPEERCTHLLGVRFPASIDTDQLGHLLKEKQIFVSFRGNAMRVAPNVYNDEEDFDKLLACFKTAYQSNTSVVA